MLYPDIDIIKRGRNMSRENEIHVLNLCPDQKVYTLRFNWIAT